MRRRTVFFEFLVSVRKLSQRLISCSLPAAQTGTALVKLASVGFIYFILCCSLFDIFSIKAYPAKKINPQSGNSLESFQIGCEAVSDKKRIASAMRFLFLNYSSAKYLIVRTI